MRNAIRMVGVVVSASMLMLGGVVGPGNADTGCTAANECGTYSLTGANVYWASQPPEGTSVHMDSYDANAVGGYISFHMNSTYPSPECSSAVQRFRFSWTFEPEVSVVSGKTNTPLTMVKALWEGDSGGACIDENPFVWIKAGGQYGPSETQQVNGDTFKFGFADQGGENRMYFNGGGSYFPTMSMNWPLYSSGGFSIIPEIKYFGHPMSIVYVYARMPDNQVSASGAASITVTPVNDRGALKVQVTPSLGDGYWVLRVQRRLADGSWLTLARAYRTIGADETRVIDLPRGVYRVLTKATSAHPSVTSTAVRLVR